MFGSSKAPFLTTLDSAPNKRDFPVRDRGVITFRSKEHLYAMDQMKYFEILIKSIHIFLMFYLIHYIGIHYIFITSKHNNSQSYVKMFS